MLSEDTGVSDMVPRKAYGAERGLWCRARLVMLGDAQSTDRIVAWEK
jgi:hypothetical protein